MRICLKRINTSVTEEQIKTYIKTNVYKTIIDKLEDVQIQKITNNTQKRKTNTFCLTVMSKKGTTSMEALAKFGLQSQLYPKSCQVEWWKGPLKKDAQNVNQTKIEDWSALV